MPRGMPAKLDEPSTATQAPIVLIVEDDPETRHFYQSVFERDRFGTFMGDYLRSFPAPSADTVREKVLSLGKKHEKEQYEDFGMTPLAIRTSRAVNR